MSAIETALHLLMVAAAGAIIGGYFAAALRGSFRADPTRDPINLSSDE